MELNRRPRSSVPILPDSNIHGESIVGIHISIILFLEIFYVITNLQSRGPRRAKRFQRLFPSEDLDFSSSIYRDGNWGRSTLLPLSHSHHRESSLSNRLSADRSRYASRINLGPLATSSLNSSTIRLEHSPPQSVSSIQRFMRAPC